MNTPKSTEFPRFMEAVNRYEAFFVAHEAASTDAEQTCEYFHEIMTACSGLVSVAQDYEFFLKIAVTQGDTTQVEQAMGVDFLDKMTDPAIPREVTAIYADLYGQDLQQCLETL